MRIRLLVAVVLALLVMPSPPSSGQTFNVTSAVGVGPGTIYSAIQQADAYGNGAIINIQLPFAQINLDDPLPDITVGMTINGSVGGDALSGENARRIFFVNAPAGQTVQISNLTLMNGLAQGGNGASGGAAGGGGAGLGGAVFINSGNVTFSAVTFQGNSAIGGNGGSPQFGGGGGGGGMGYGGGAGYGNANFLGGGGGGGARTSAGANGANNGTGNGGNGGGAHGAVAGIGGSEDPRGLSATLPDGGGGGGGFDVSIYLSNFPIPNGGNGSDFGGGGGGGSSLNNNSGNGGNGGFGAGGGGGADSGGGYAGGGGNGGFGGGGGGGGGTPNEALYGNTIGGGTAFGGGLGGAGNLGAGGGGAAFGAAVFVRSGSVTFTNSAADGGSLTPGGAGISALGDGHNGTAGSAAGGTLFLTGGNATFSVSTGNTETIAGSIAQSSASSITVTGGGTVLLTAANSYSGGTTINGGTLRVQNFGLPATSIVINAAGTLQYDTSTGNINQLRADLSGTGKLVKTGAGQLLFGNAGANMINWNFSSGALIDVQGGTLVGGTSINDFWTGDYASLNIASGAIFQGVEANVQIDALTGAGTFIGGYAFGGIETIGVANGSGMFLGSIQDTSIPSGYLLSLIKAGTGTETLSGVNTYSGSTTINNGTLATTATGTLGSGPLAVNAASGVTSVVTLGNNQTVSQLSGTITGTGSATVNVAAGKKLTVSQSANTSFAGAVALATGATAGTGGALAKSAEGVLEIDGGLTLGSNSSLSVSGGILRLKVGSTPSVGVGVTASVSGTAVLELAGTASVLGTAIAADRVTINDSSNAAAGLLISAGNQQVGAIGGAGNVQVNAGASLTADHIVQTALIIGGTAGSHGLVTIDGSGPSGNPLAGTRTPGEPFAASGDSESSDLGAAAVELSPSSGANATGLAAVPEPASLILLAVGGLALGAATLVSKGNRKGG